MLTSRQSIQSAHRSRCWEMATETRRDAEGGARDTDAHADLPLETKAMFLEGERRSPGDRGSRSLSVILALSEHATPRGSSTAGTETFKKDAGGGRDSDIAAAAGGTETKVATPVGRDKDIEQLDYAAIGARSAD